MKWGVRRYQNPDGTLTVAGKKRYSSGEKMDTSDKRDSSVTRRVKTDYNNLSDSEFRSKYQTSKEVYRRRVNRYGDPYMNSPLAKFGKRQIEREKLKKEQQEQKIVDRAIKRVRNIDEDIKSFPTKGSITTKKGRVIFSEEEIKDLVRSLNTEKLNIITKTDSYDRGLKESQRIMSELSEKYIIKFDITTGGYTLEDRE